MFRVGIVRCSRAMQSGTRPSVLRRSFTPTLQVLAWPPPFFSRVRLFSSKSGKDDSKKKKKEYKGEKGDKKKEKTGKEPKKEKEPKQEKAPKKEKDPTKEKKPGKEEKITPKEEEEEVCVLKTDEHSEPKEKKKESKKDSKAFDTQKAGHQKIVESTGFIVVDSTDRPSLDELAALDFHANVTRVNAWRGYLEMKEAMKQLATKYDSLNSNSHVDDDRTKIIEAKLESREVNKNLGRKQSSKPILNTQESHLTDQDVDALFSAMDMYCTGYIHYNEFVIALRSCEIDLHEKTKLGLFKVADANKDGVLDKSEFRNFIKKIREQGHFFMEKNP